MCPRHAAEPGETQRCACCRVLLYQGMLIIAGVSKGEMKKLKVSETFYEYHNAAVPIKSGSFCCQV